MDRNEAEQLYYDLCEVENRNVNNSDGFALVGACRAAIGYFLELTKGFQRVERLFEYDSPGLPIQPPIERIVHRFDREKKEWHSIKFRELKTGDIFKMFEPSGRYTDVRGNNVWISASDAVKDDHGTWSINLLY